MTRRRLYALTDAEARAAREALGARLAGEVDGRSSRLESYEGAWKALSTPLTGLLSAAHDAVDALNAEQMAALGDDNPIITAHGRVLTRLRTALAHLKGTPP